MRTDLFTVGDISRELDNPRHRVTYAIDKLGLNPVTRAGIIRLFSREQVDEIRATLALDAEASDA